MFWGGNTMWEQADLPWDASTPSPTHWFSVASCSQHGHHPYQASPWEMPMWGSKAAAQHVARTPRACSSLPLLPCHLGQAVPWPHTSAKKLVKGLKLLQAREKIRSLKKDMSQPHSPSRALFVSFLILAHPKHVFKLLLPQPQELETCFKKKEKKEKKPIKLGFQPNQSTLEAGTIKITREVLRAASAANVAVVPPPPLAAWRDKHRHSAFSRAQRHSHVLRKTGLFWQELPESKRFIHVRKTDFSIYNKPAQRLPAQLLRAVQGKGTKRFFGSLSVLCLPPGNCPIFSQQDPPSWNKSPWLEIRHPMTPRGPARNGAHPPTPSPPQLPVHRFSPQNSVALPCLCCWYCRRERLKDHKPCLHSRGVSCEKGAGLPPNVDLAHHTSPSTIYTLFKSHFTDKYISMWKVILNRVCKGVWHRKGVW